MATEVSHKAIESAKYFGSKHRIQCFIGWISVNKCCFDFTIDLIFNAANRAGQTMTATAKHIKQSVEHVVSFHIDF